MPFFFQEKTRVLFAKDTEINPPVILKKLQEILGARGKKGTDRTDQIEYLKDLRKISEKHNLGLSSFKSNNFKWNRVLVPC